jgi:hypothetical protein
MTNPDSIATPAATPLSNEDLNCPLCGYSLRGLPEARCPECGYRCVSFDEMRAIHPYLFEHHPEKNVRSFLHTTIATLRPWRFWRQLKPTHRPNLRRVLIYAIVTQFLGILSLALFIVAMHTRLAISWCLAHNDLVAKYPPSYVQPATLKDFYALMTPHIAEQWPGWALLPFAAILGCPTVTFLALLIFEQTRRRARILRVQILRCVVYALDPSPLILFCCIPLLFISHNGIWSSQPWTYVETSIACATLIFTCIFSPIRLVIAYRRYLAFPHALPTVAVTEIIALLTCIAVIIAAFGSVSVWLMCWYR